ncbi:MAG: hypothetical protein NT047_09480 [Deltaproteobacteria bacterium]|nr:hypothetical protein [Deltaproteobacteria bacterium]
MSKKVVEIVGEFCLKGSRIGVRRQLQYRQRQDVEIPFCIIDEGFEPGKKKRQL